MRAASTAWMLAGSSSCPASTATSCSTNSGLPSARRAIRSAGAPAPSRSASSRASASPSASSISSERLRCGAAQVGTGLEQLRPGEADDEDRRSARERHDVVERVQQRGRGPVHVLGDDHDRLLVRDPLQQPPQRPGRLLRRHRLGREPERAEQRAQRPLVVAQQRFDPAARIVPEHLRQRVVGRALAGGQAAAGEHGRALAERRRELRHEARLADARHPGDGHEPAHALRGGAGERDAAARRAARPGR